MSNFYIFPLKSREAFKVGKADDVNSRLIRLLKFYEIDTDSIVVVKCPNQRAAFDFENIMICSLKEHNCPMLEEGGTEFFDYSAYRLALNLCEILSRIKKLKMEKFCYTAPPESEQGSGQDIEKKYSRMVKMKRLELDITEVELARVAGVSKSTVQRFEKNQQANFDKVLKIFAALGISPDLGILPSTRRKRSSRKTKMVFVGDSDHEPDKEWVQEIEVKPD